MKTLVCLFFLLTLSSCFSNQDWRTASRQPAGIAPAPETTSEAVLHIYGADAWGWRGLFAIHTWIAAKRSDQDYYLVYDVVGWRARHGKPVLQATRDYPDRYWYGEKPFLIKGFQGDNVDILIAKVEKAVASYPWKQEYKAFPGPNSNTFTAWVGKEVPELNLELPYAAIGSGFIDRQLAQN